MRYAHGFCTTCAIAVILHGSAHAQITSVPHFTGEYREGFEGPFPLFFEPQLSCFGGKATANQVGGTLGILVVGGVGTVCGTMQQNSGVKFLSPWLEVNVEVVFEHPAQRFGGYFGTICQKAGGTAEFYDEAGALMATMPMNVPTAGQWAWNGWKAASPGFKRIRIIAADLDGHVMHDGMQLDFFGDCYADCDESGALTVADLACFQSRFVAGDLRADCNASAGSSSLSLPTFSVADFACFQNAFFVGCP